MFALFLVEIFPRSELYPLECLTPLVFGLSSPLVPFVPLVEDPFLLLIFTETGLTPWVFSQRYIFKPSVGLFPIYQCFEFADCRAGCSNPEKPLLLHACISRHILLTPWFDFFNLFFYLQFSLCVTQFLCPGMKCWTDRGNVTFLWFQQITTSPVLDKWGKNESQGSEPVWSFHPT